MFMLFTRAHALVRAQQRIHAASNASICCLMFGIEGNSSIKANEGFNVRGGVSELPGEGHPTHDHGHIYTHAHGHTHAHTLSPTGCCVSGNVCIGGSSSEGSWVGDEAQ
eukprot:1161286-Pelagomonas_calceolata.AAC.2